MNTFFKKERMCSEHKRNQSTDINFTMSPLDLKSISTISLQSNIRQGVKQDTRVQLQVMNNLQARSQEFLSAGEVSAN